jgi:hypothetical protein
VLRKGCYCWRGGDVERRGEIDEEGVRELKGIV